ncbi:AVN_HP_G0112480.mRNA.1.CDS.1 [Saccharomyces cerevisiae]|nr:AVN_HP_G0018610.mRNA.1.CDS.1 [Saccharomyces cerevisiae]CAI5148270.1 AVN_HP_G0112480.mRNA.1.CDS.1 [Saccharomyces cerevisiae]CAI6726004.1 AVN_HP_G0018610.mRNA.1.CDS.1 [Saccharomyces cerevisiae]CAI6990403.1 AVN_HP_G0112480.mRNA.1.CDS.1 [Saccharomyces cerevisiae]CAI7295822.1 AVN_collapsed_G0044510.mRNA.1.CDS.1 [Saccharomyces cerevisiae]
MAFWLPQNIQKRLLLYVLQQISLFSNIDLSNLDVSIGSKSHFSFHDVNLSLDDLNIPNVQINEGIVDELVLKLTVSGGVEIDGSGLRFIMTPLYSSGSQELHSDFLVKSIQDLTNSMLKFSDPLTTYNRYKEDDISSSDSSSDLNSNIEASKPAANGSYTLQNMRNKALNVALAKLKIALKDVTIRFIVNDRDPSDNIVEVHLESIQLITTDANLRHINIENITISSIQKQAVPDSPVHPFNNDDLSQSVYLSKMEATSLYMSAMEEQSNEDPSEPQVTQEEQENDKCKESLMEINNLNIAFKGLSSVNDLRMSNIVIDIQDVHLAIHKIVEIKNSTLKNIIDIIVTHLDANESFSCQDSQSPSPDKQEPSALSSVDIKCIYLNLGQDITVILKSFKLEQKENNSLAFSLGSFYSNSSPLTISHKTKPLLTGEQTPQSIALNMGDELDIIISHDGIAHFFKIFQFVSKCMSFYQNKSKGMMPQIASDTKRTVQLTSKAVKLSLKFPYFLLCFQVSPFIYDSNRELYIELVDVFKKLPSRCTKILTMSSITISNLQSPLQLGSYDDTLKEALIYSSVHAIIKEVIFNEEYSGIVQLVEDISAFGKLFTDSKNSECTGKSKSKRGSFLQRSVRVLNSSRFVYKQSLSANFSLKIDSMKLKVSEIIGPQFGSVEALLSNNFFAITDDSQIVYFTKNLKVERKTPSLLEPQEIMSVVLNKAVNEPVLYVHRRANGKLKVIFNNIRIHYYARWLEILKKNIGPDNASSKDEPVAQKLSKKQPTSGFPWELKCLDCSLILHPFRLKSVMVIVLDNLTTGGSSFSPQAKLLSKANTLFLIDDYQNFKIQKDKNWPSLINFYAGQGFSAIGKIDTLNFLINKSDGALLLDCKIEQAGLSLCADSFQTFCQLCIDLKYPQTFPDEEKFRTQLKNPIDVFKDIDCDLFNSAFIRENNHQNDYDSVHLVDSFLDKTHEFNNGARSKLSSQGSYEMDSSSGTATGGILLPHESYLDSAQPKEEDTPPIASKEQERDVDIRGSIDVEKVVIKLFDGYDWKYTRKFIANTVEKLDKELSKAEASSSKSNVPQSEANIFDSIYISANKNNVTDLRRNLDGEIQGVQNSFSDVSKVNLRPSKHYKALIQLNKVHVNLKNYRVDEPDESNSDNSTDVLNRCVVSIYEFEIIDNVPTSTWNKFVTLLKHEPWPHSSPMFLLDLEFIRPIDFLQAVELVMQLNVAPLRLHVDQDTLEFLIRFLGFKDKRFELIDEYPDIVFIQKFSTNSIKLRLDYKPKKVDYAGLRSGQTSELMNFFTLDGSKIILKSVVLYGLNGFDELNNKLKAIWTPDITKKQLPGVLEGLAPVRSFMAIGSGVKTLVTVLMSEYRQEGHLGRSLKKGGNVFLKTTTGDFVKLGVKLTSGTQAILENTEELFGGVGSNGRVYDASKFGSADGADSDTAAVLDLDTLFEEDQLVGSKYSRIRDHEPTAVVIDMSSPGDHNEPTIVSLYADQPLDLPTGLKEAYSSLEKHMHIAYDAVWRAKGQMKDDKRGGPSAAAVYVARAAPVAIIRPLIGATEAVSKTLQGIANQVDKTHNEQINDKYKSNRTDS